MIPQGFPLYGAWRAAGRVYLIVGWVNPSNRQPIPVCVQVGALWPMDEPWISDATEIYMTWPGEWRVSTDRDEVWSWADKG